MIMSAMDETGMAHPQPDPVRGDADAPGWRRARWTYWLVVAGIVAEAAAIVLLAMR